MTKHPEIIENSQYKYVHLPHNNAINGNELSTYN